MFKLKQVPAVEIMEEALQRIYVVSDFLGSFWQ